jgi:antitoxin component YwqK of YwqJK toxin-antitoxin module
MTQWHTHGEKQIEGNYKDEKRDELWQVWYENGQKSSEGNYKNGKAVGLWEVWYESGQKNENNFKDGKLMSIVVWKTNGKLSAPFPI